jgi:hypothetical protein
MSIYVTNVPLSVKSVVEMVATPVVMHVICVLIGYVINVWVRVYARNVIAISSVANV